MEETIQIFKDLDDDDNIRVVYESYDELIKEAESLANDIAANSPMLNIVIY